MKFVAKYNYQDIDGNTVYTINRTEDKIFIPTTPTETPYEEITRVPYNLPKLLSEASLGGTVWVVESEKSADLLNSLGLVATCSAGGCGWPWPKNWKQYFEGAQRVYVCADNDEPGTKAARSRARIISLGCEDVRILTFEELSQKDDVWDYLQTYTVDDLWKKGEYAEPVKLFATAITLNTEEQIISYLLRQTDNKREVLDSVTTLDFADAFLRSAFVVILSMDRLGLPPQPSSVAARMIENGYNLPQKDIENKLWALYDQEYPNNAYRTLVDDLINASTKRSVEAATKSVIATINASTSSEDLVKAWEEAGKHIRTVISAAEPSPKLDEFMQVEDEYNWMIPDYMEWKDRLLLIGKEGHGKSVMIRQWAVQCAAGVHWWKLTPFTGLRTLIIDRENSPGQVRRGIARAVEAADKMVGKAWHDNLMIDSVPSAIDILKPHDRKWLESKIVANRPQVLVLSPLYKLFNDNASQHQELNAQTVVKIIDDWRDRYGVAVIIEGHAPHGETGRNRVYRPVGSSLWLRWPEQGLGITPTDKRDYYELKPFRGSRNEVYLPRYVFWNPDRDQGWPWLWTDSLDDDDDEY